MMYEMRQVSSSIDEFHKAGRLAQGTLAAIRVALQLLKGLSS